MGAKGTIAGTKRKSAPGGKADTNGTLKKAKFGAPRKNFEKEDAVSETSNDIEDDSDGSDLDEGGARLGAQPDKKSQKGDKPKGNGGPGGKGFEISQNSREAHAKQKELARERKAAKPLADELHRLKKLWEKLRRKSHVAKDERQTLVEELYSIITGRVKEFVLKHDAVRAVQTAIKYATPDQRKQIAKELQGSYSQLAESKYAKFLIGKLLVQKDNTKDNEIRDMIIPEFYGKVRRLINHSEASWILDDIYRSVATRAQKATLLREWYGPEFALFKLEESAQPSADLRKILEDEPSKRGTVQKYLFDMINGLIQKKLTGFTMLHDAMLQYFLILTPESSEAKEFLEVIKEDENGDLLKNMAFTKSGARLACLLLAYGNAKDRRAIMKTYKDTFQLMCGDDHGHSIILTAYDVIDDTVTTSKAIFPELLGKEEEKRVENILFLANNLNARTTICYLFEGMAKSLFPTSHATDLEILEEVHKIRETTSKKNAETRRHELIAALSPQLLAAIAAAPTDLLATSFGAMFVTTVLLGAEGDKSAALEAIASTAAGDPSLPAPENVYPPPPPHIANTPHGGRMLKTLIVGGRFDKEAGCVKQVDPPLKFADILYPHIKENLVAWATGPSSFTVVALLEAPEFSHVKEVKSALKKNKILQKAASEETPDQKAKRESAGEVKTAKSKSKKKAGSAEKQFQVGNAGTKLLLEKLEA